MKKLMPVSAKNKLKYHNTKKNKLLKNISREDIRLVYTFDKKLGSGAFGSVRIATKDGTSKKFSVKSIKRELIEGDQSDFEDLRQELQILLSVDHPNILQLNEVYLDHKYFHMVTELLDGGPIDPKQEVAGKFSEVEAAKIIRQSLQAINYLHQQNVVHRDLKTDNILYNDRSKKFVKIIDFGFAKLCQNADLSDIRGTPYFMAPEVLRGDYTFKCDLWSIGVVAFYLLSGKLPFTGKNEQELEEAILCTDYDIDTLEGVSKNAKKFIEKLLEPSVDERMGCEEALAHAWITDHQPQRSEAAKTKIAQVFQRLKRYRGLDRFQMKLMQIFISHISEERLSENQEAFHAIDEDNGGHIEQVEMLMAIEDLKLTVPDLDLTADDI